MGLLDSGVFDSDQFRLGMGLLAAGGARGDGANTGQRLQEALSGLDSYKANKLKQKMDEMKLAEQQQQIEQARGLREAASSSFRSPDMANAMSMGPAMGGGSVPQVQPGFDSQGYINKLYGMGMPDKALAMQQLLKKDTPKFSTAPQYDQQGNAFILAEDGSMKYLGGVKARDKLNEVRLGDKVGFRTDYSPEIQGSLPIGQSPDSKASNAVSWANNALTKQRLDFDKSQTGKPQYHDGSWVIPPSAANPQGASMRVPGMPDKPLTESQGAAANFGGRAKQAHEILNTLEKDGGGRPGTIKRVAVASMPGLGMGLDDSVGTMMNWTQSATQQQAEQAQTNFITAVLRKESGASISPGEFITAAKIYFPQPGDSEGVILQKQKTRQAAIAGLSEQAGPGAKFINRNAPEPLGKGSGVRFLGFEGQ